jgi:CRISPR-associated protein Csd1
MILQALTEYYERSGELAAEGWEWKRIPVFIEIARDGTFVQLTSLRTGKKASDVTPSLVPMAEIRSGTRAFERPNALWDHFGFVLGHPKSDSVNDRQIAEKQLNAFRQRVLDLIQRCASSEGLDAIRRFYEREQFRQAALDPLWPECVKTLGCNMTFRLTDATDHVALEPQVRALFGSPVPQQETTEQVCLVTGEMQPIQQLHFPIAGVGAKPAPLAAINDGSNPAFASFGRQQGTNFPVGQPAVFQYATALNHLLRPGSRQRMQIGDASTVFWAHKANDADVEDWFAQAFGDTDAPDARTDQVRALFEAAASGRFDGARGANLFYVLGLAPNRARIVVRYWHAAPLNEIAHRVRAWFDDVALVRAPYDAEFPPLKRLLSAVCLATKDRPYGDIERLPPKTAGDVMRSILGGGELPASLLNAAVQRCRAEQAKKDDQTGKPVRHVSYLRAALIRACLNRHSRIHAPHRKEIAVSLDKTNKDKPYLLGRLFATFERMQEVAADRELNRSIRDSYFGAAMATPRSVFPRLVRLNQQHLRELKRGRPPSAAYFDRLLREINDDLDPATAFPATCTLHEQGVFAIGYYHQRHDFFPKANAGPTDKPEPTNQGS